MLKATLLATFQTNGTTAESTVTLNCNTLTGTPPSATIVVKAAPALTLTNQLIVSATLAGTNLADFVITAPSIQTLALSGANTATSLTYTVTLAATPLIGCQGLTSSTVATVNFFHIAGTAAVPNASSTPVVDVTVGVSTTVNAGSSVASALTTSIGTVNLTCQKVGSSYYPGNAVTVTVGSGATGGTPFTLDASAPDNSVVYPTAIPGGSVAPASGTQVTFTVQANSTCGGNGVSVTPVVTTISLQSALLGSGVTVADKTITVSMVVSGASPSALTVSLPTINITCALASAVGYPGTQYTQSIGAANATPFTVDTTVDGTIPTWLNLNGGTSIAGTASNTNPVQFPVQVINSVGNQCGGKSVQSTAYTYTVYLASTNLPQLEQSFVVNLTVSGPGASPLVVVPSPITVTCLQTSNGIGGFNYTPNYAQTISVTSAASGGTAYTITSPGVSWLTIGTPNTLTAGISAATFTIQAASTCHLGVNTSVAVHLANAPNNDQVFEVYLQVVTSVALTASPSSASFKYVKGSGTAGFADVAISTTLLSVYYSVNSVSLPSWLRSDPASGSAGSAGPQSIRFSSTSVADTLAPGTWTASVVLSVSGYGDLTIPVSMLLTNKAAQMTIQGPTTVSLTWTEGGAYPTPTITVLSTDTPIAYVATTGGSLGPQIPVNEQSGLAYSFGTPISVTFSPQAFASAAPGSILTGTVTLTWGTPASTIVVTFDVNVQAAGATISGLSPSTEPYSSSATSFTVALTGTGYVQGVPITQATRVGIVTSAGSPMDFDPAISATVVNGSNITLLFSYPGAGYVGPIPFTSALAATDAYHSVLIGVCNPVGGACSVATATQVLYFGSAPIVQAVVSSSTLKQSGSTPNLALFDMVSIFGSNFCPNCASSGSNSILTNSPDPLALTYPKSLTFTPTSAQIAASPSIPGGTLTVTFQHDATGSALVATPVPLLFATNGQINLMVPSTDPTGGNPVPTGLVDVVVTYTPAGGTAQVSAIYPVNIVATDPGIFTVGADGQGNGAILDMNYNLISSTNPAGVRSVAVTGNSDVVSVYMTGLGVPDSTGDDTLTGGGAWSADCVSPSSYLTAFNAQNTGTAIASLDGTLIMTGPLASGRVVPCLTSGGTDHVSVTIGGQPVTVIKYAGWTPDTISGLYQVSFQLPDNIVNGFTPVGGSAQTITAPIQLPIYITSDTNTTQAGVSIWMAPSLLMAAPTTLTSLKVGTPLENPVTSGYVATNSVVALGGTTTYTYAITSGLLPPGLSLIPNGAFGGQITGTPNASTGTPGSNSYKVTVTATDSGVIPVTGSVTFTLTVGAGLFMTDTSQTTATFGTANLDVTAVTATGGTAPYYYELLADSGNYTTDTHIAINQSSGQVSTTIATKAGTYSLAVTAGDNVGTPLSTTTFPIVVGLDMPSVTPISVTASTWSVSVAYNSAILPTGGGAPGTSYAFAVDAITSAFLAENSWVTFDTTSGIFTIGTLPVVTPSFTVTVTATDTGTTPSQVSSPGTGVVTFPFVIH